MFLDADKPKVEKPLKSVLWKSYVSASLIPLFLIEVTFLAIYWGTGQFVFERGAEVVTETSTKALEDSVTREAETISARLQTVSAMTKLYAEETGRALQSPADVDQSEKDRHAFSPDGAFYSTADNGGSAVFYSGVLPIGPEEIDKVWRTVRLDPIMKSIVDSDGLIAQVYVNTFDSLNRIYPYFDVLDIYAPKMDIPSYNFYYEADVEHNPDGKVVWTDAYIDPAGSGWMLSAIAPVMGPEKLEAVVGIDVTIRSIVDSVLNIELAGDGYAMLVGRDGTILALPPEAQADFGLTELLDHSYSQAILEDTFKPAEFNLFRRQDIGDLAIALHDSESGTLDIDLGRPVIASWATIAGTGWRLIAVASEEALLEKTMNLRDTLSYVTQIMMAGLVAFYCGYFLLLWRRSQKMSERVANPLSDLETQMQRIADGAEPRLAPDSDIAELNRANTHLFRMGEQLMAVNRAKAAFLSAMSHELRTPLNSIFSHAELLRMAEETKGQTAARGHIDGILRSGKNLLSLIEGVIDYSATEQGEITTQVGKEQLLPVIETAVARVTDLAREMAVSVNVDLGANPIEVQTDPKLLARIVENLLLNAVKYNVKGGDVFVTTARIDEGQIRLSIRDTGNGISPEMQDRLFVPFDRLGRENSTITGVGVGMAIARRRAERIGCKLAFVESSHQGSTFAVDIPLAK